MGPLPGSPAADAIRNALVLLGFDPQAPALYACCGGAAAASSAAEVVELLLSPSSSSLVVAKLFEAVCWFLLHRINPERTSQGREFRTVVTKELEKMKREGAIPSFVQVRRSYFDDCRGERFEIALVSLSMIALQVSLANDFRVTDAGLYAPIEITAAEEPDTLQFDISTHELNFSDNERERKHQERSWRTFMESLNSELEVLANAKLPEEVSEQNVAELEAVRREKLDIVEMLSFELDEMDKRQEDDQGIVDTALSVPAGSMVLRSSGFDAGVTQDLLQSFELPMVILRINCWCLKDLKKALDTRDDDVDNLKTTQDLHKDLAENVASLKLHLQLKQKELQSAIDARVVDRQPLVSKKDDQSHVLEFAPKTPKIKLRNVGARPKKQAAQEGQSKPAPVSSGITHPIVKEKIRNTQVENLRASSFDLRTPARPKALSSSNFGKSSPTMSAMRPGPQPRQSNRNESDMVRALSDEQIPDVLEAEIDGPGVDVSFTCGFPPILSTDEKPTSEDCESFFLNDEQMPENPGLDAYFACEDMLPNSPTRRRDATDNGLRGSAKAQKVVLELNQAMEGADSVCDSSTARTSSPAAIGATDLGSGSTTVAAAKPGSGLDILIDQNDWPPMQHTVRGCLQQADCALDTELQSMSNMAWADVFARQELPCADIQENPAVFASLGDWAQDQFLPMSRLGNASEESNSILAEDQLIHLSYCEGQEGIVADDADMASSLIRQPFQDDLDGLYFLPCEKNSVQPSPKMSLGFPAIDDYELLSRVAGRPAEAEIFSSFGQAPLDDVCDPSQVLRISDIPLFSGQTLDSPTWDRSFSLPPLPSDETECPDDFFAEHLDFIRSDVEDLEPVRGT
ncbi:hypothetical protein HK405_004265 [Cladochytrium tenue]|nr:hypothetical protein HK405_004265 [Cladochytrium tenue]